MDGFNKVFNIFPLLDLYYLETFCCFGVVTHDEWRKWKQDRPTGKVDQVRGRRNMLSSEADGGGRVPRDTVQFAVGRIERGRVGETSEYALAAAADLIGNTKLLHY